MNSNTGWNSGEPMKCMENSSGSKVFERLLMCVVILGVVFAGPVWGAKGDDPGEKIVKIDIRILETGKDARFWDSVARDLIQVRSGEVYGLDLIAQAIARLSDSAVFQSIHVPDPVKTLQGVEIVFELVPYSRIKDIRIFDAFPVFDREVINVMTLYPGDAYSSERLEEQKIRVITLFQKRGFIDPKVDLSAHREGADGNYVVSVHIDKGDFFRVNQVEIQGNVHFSSARLKLRTQTWKSSLLFGSARRFVQKNLDEDVKNFIAFYREKGFADVGVRAEAVKNLKTKEVNVTFHINEGPRYRIGFEGNETFWDYTLNKEMTLSRDGNKNNFALGKSIRNLEEKYAQKGYPDAKIQPRIKEKTPSQPLVKQVILDIDEGYQYQVSKFEITGNQAISQDEILKSVLTRAKSPGKSGIFVPKTLDEDINAVRALYLREGFTQIRVDKHVRVLDVFDPGQTKTKQVEIDLVVVEGVQTKVGSVRFEGLSVLSRETALGLISLKPDAPFREYMIQNDENSLKQKISELGYPHIRVTGSQNIDSGTAKIALTYAINQGPHTTTGQIYYVGNFRTKAHILDNEMEVSPGDPLSLKKLLESRRNMMDMNALDSVGFRSVGLAQGSQEVDIIVQVEEKKPYSFEMGTGYDTERHLYVNSGVGDHNFLGRNLDFQLEGEVSQIGYKANVSLLEPRFLSTRIGSTSRIFGENQEEFNKDFGTRIYGVSQKFFQQFFSKKLSVNLGLMYEAREQYQTQAQDLTLEEMEDYDPRHIFTVSPGLVYKTTDSYVKPQKGSISSLNVDIAKGIDDHLDDYIKYRLDTRHYYSLLDPLVLALRGRYGFIDAYGGASRVAEDQLFFLGGTSSVRGFGENLLEYDTSGQALGGREVILGSIELRYDLALGFELTSFYDIGAIRRTQSQGGSDGFRDSVGLGLRYMTPIGPIGFLYGWKLDPRPEESAGSFHFSMGYTF
ncbi:MAG: outer membrane protein assembly factor BamA [Proteobacteria bacterium]|nr:outer membrane protein assembly factor BamA [Pseudomonadota bacterium]